VKWRGVILNAVFASLVLLEGVITVATHTDDKPAWPKHWDTRVLPIVAFVESERGLTFKHPAPVRFLSDAAFQKEVSPKRTDSAKDKAELGQAVRMLRALGLVAGKVDLRKAESDLLQSDIVGLYVPSKKTVFVRGSALTPATRVVLAHELTHVLQDQYFDLQKMKESAPGGDTGAVTALIEGDAVRVQKAYADELSAADKRSYARTERDQQRASAIATSGMPPVLSDFLSFPYVFGPVLLQDLIDTDGNTEVDKAFRHPPSEEAQVFDPVHHPYTEKAISLPAPAVPAGAKRVDKPAPFGEVSLFEVLSSRVGYGPALHAVQSWRADTSQAYVRGGTTCMAIDVVVSGSNALLLRTARSWASGTHATVTGTGSRVEIRSCDPGSRARIPKPSSPSPFEVLSARASLTSEFMTHGLPIAKATCIADGFISGLGPAHLDLLLASSLTQAQTTRLQAIARAAAQRC
jgi:hypothetical protein